MIVLLKLIFIFSITFAKDETDNDEVKDMKRYGESSWQNSMETNNEEPILASIVQVDLNLQPKSKPFLGIIYNNFDIPVQPNLAYFSDDAPEYLTTDFYTRRTVNGDEQEIIFYCDYISCPSETYSCESTVEATSKNNTRIRTTTLCLSSTYEVLRRTILTSIEDSSGMFYYEKDSEMDEEENIFHCDDLTCPSKTNICKSTFRPVPEEFVKIEVTTLCISAFKEVLAKQVIKINNPLNDRFYYKLEVIDSKNDKHEIKR